MIDVELHPNMPKREVSLLYPLLRMSPRLESLSLRGHYGRNIDFSAIDKLKHLRVLHLTLHDPAPEPDETCTRHILASPSLEMVHITGSSDYFTSLGSLTATWLSRMVVYPFEPTSQTIRVSGRDWPSLETLNLWMEEGNAIKRVGHTISVMSLRQLNISSRPIVITMIHHLAMCPEDLPSLTAFHLSSCPEWDTLFIMLEKRLLLQTSGVKPIETIGFSRMIPPGIKSALAQLLAGYIVPRPSNYDLSMHGNLDIFLDGNM